MKRTLFLYILLLAVPSFSQTKTKFQIGFISVYNKETFHWSIAGNENGENPNVLSELRFKTQKVGFSLNACYRLTSGVQIYLGYSLHKSFKGSVTDIDYLGDNRTRSSSVLNYQSRKGHENNYHLAIGYKFLDHKQYQLSAALGYDFTNSIYFLQGNIWEDPKGIYTPKWHRSNLCTTADWFYTPKIGLEAQLIFSYLFYNAEADWLLRTDFRHPVSFSHKAQGFGMDGHMGVFYQLSPTVKLQIDGRFQRWKTGYGIDILYLSNENVAKTRMNESVKEQVGIAIITCFGF